MLASNKKSLEEAMHFSPHQRPASHFLFHKCQFIEVRTNSWPNARDDGTNEGLASGLSHIIAVFEFKDVRPKIFQH